MQLTADDHGGSVEDLETPWEKKPVMPEFDCLANQMVWGLELDLNRFKDSKGIWLRFPT